MADKKHAAQTPEEVAAAQKFTEQDENRKLAFTKALELLRILNKDHLELEMLAQRPYTRTEDVYQRESLEMEKYLTAALEVKR